MTVKDFINQLAPVVMREAHRRGYRFPSAIIAQAVLESGEGTAYRSELCDVHNYFSIKAGTSWKGAVKTIKCDEYLDGKWVKVPGTFRAYASMEDSIKDYFNFISAARYSNLKGASSPVGYIYNLHLDGYATDPIYLNKVMERYTLYSIGRFDIPEQIIRGEWGNGLDRIAQLTKAGYNATLMQRWVNEVLS